MVGKLRARLDALGIPHLPNPGHIVPVMVKDPVKCKMISDVLLDDYGVYVQPINYPTVPKGTERLRFTPGPHAQRRRPRPPDGRPDRALEALRPRPRRRLTPAFLCASRRVASTCPSLAHVSGVRQGLACMTEFVDGTCRSIRMRPCPGLPRQPDPDGMIVCSCTGVTDRDIRQAIAWMRASDPYTLITPGKIYRALGKAADCGGCVRLFVEQMRTDANLAVPVELRACGLGPGQAGRGSLTAGADLERFHVAGRARLP